MTDAKRDAAIDLVKFGLSIAKACTAVRLSRASFYRTPRNWRIADAAVIDALNEQLKKSPHAGFWKCYQRLRRAGHVFNHKRSGVLPDGIEFTQAHQARITETHRAAARSQPVSKSSMGLGFYARHAVLR